jgi:hypothetical protein
MKLWADQVKVIGRHTSFMNKITVNAIIIKFSVVTKQGGHWSMVHEFKDSVISAFIEYCHCVRAEHTKL